MTAAPVPPPSRFDLPQRFSKDRQRARRATLESRRRRYRIFQDDGIPGMEGARLLPFLDRWNGASRLREGLSWLVEKMPPKEAFISTLPPELVRKGRFDEIFFVDLPTADVRHSILSIDLGNRDQSLKNFDLAELTRVSKGFSGAEIEQAIVSSLYAAHAKREPLATAHVLAEIEATRPLSVVMAERIDAMRQWAAGRTVSCD